MKELQGLLLLDKPQGWTSFDVVAKVRGVIQREVGHKVKVGHSGTLDPAATGLLVLAIGRATKQLQGLTKLDKTYQAELTLGVTSTTDDSEGEQTPVRDASQPSEEQVQAVLRDLIGAIKQTPPAFSAIKIDGKRAYKLARAGKEVKLEPRVVTIHEITAVNYAYPRLSFEVSVSSGTYIRSLARDIGNALGTGAYLSGLRRTKIDSFDVADAITVEEISYNFIEKNIQK